MTLSLPGFCKVDSLVYPQYSIDTEGQKIVIINESQERFFTRLYLQSKKDSTILSLKQQYIDQLEHQLSLSKAVDQNKSELISRQESIISLNKDEISLLRNQASTNRGIIGKLENQVEQRNKVMKRKILGWKIATGVTIGVSVAVITGAAIILAQ